MSENTQLATQGSVQLLPVPSQWELIQGISSKIARANGMSEDKMANILLLGFSVGLSIPASLELVQTVQGKTSLAPRGAWALVQNSPVIAETKLTRLTDKNGAFVGYECYIKRANGFEFTGRWTMEQARAAGLVKPGSGWEHYQENMCMWRAIGFCCDVAASDVTSGLTAFMKMPEAYGAEIDNGGNIITISNLSPANISHGPSVVDLLNDLVDDYGPDAVLAAGGGQLPETVEKCYEIHDTLEMAARIEAQNHVDDAGGAK